jgi:hypothetical protein
MLETMPAEGASSGDFLEHHLKTVAGIFDIWAGGLSRTAKLTDDAADAFGHLLIELEKAMLAQASTSRPSFIPERLNSSKVKGRLNQRTQYWTGQMLRRVREHKEASRASANRKDGAETKATSGDESKFPLEGDRDTAPKEPPFVQPPTASDADVGGHPADPNLQTRPAWNERLRTARGVAGLSRPGAARRLKTAGIQITADAIKKHEEGAAMPRPDVRRSYAVIYKSTEDELFR